MNITPSNLPNQKMSTLFWSVLQDIKKVEKLKLNISFDMNMWSSVDNNICTVCLGGAACLGFVENKYIDTKVIEQIHDVYFGSHVLDGIKFSVVERKNVRDMMNMFNEFRCNDIKACIKYYNKFSKIIVPRGKATFIANNFKAGQYDGEIDDTIPLIKDIKTFATFLETNNL